jgi:hypothetical protein
VPHPPTWFWNVIKQSIIRSSTTISFANGFTPFPRSRVALAANQAVISRESRGKRRTPIGRARGESDLVSGVLPPDYTHLAANGDTDGHNIEPRPNPKTRIPPPL